MDIAIIIVCITAFTITLIGTLAYSVRIVGVRTRKIAITFALFNVLALVSRVAANIQAPILTKYTETSGSNDLLFYFYMVLVSSGIATIVGALFIPTFQRVFYRCVNAFSVDRSIFKILLYGFTKSGIKQFRSCMTIPSKNNVKEIKMKKMPKKIILFNLIVVAMLTVGALAPIYAGRLEPDLRATCLTLSGVVSGIATVILYVFIDPFLSVKTDDVIEGKCSENEFRKYIVTMVGTKIVGTFIAIPLLIPFSKLIVIIAKVI